MKNREVALFLFATLMVAFIFLAACKEQSGQAMGFKKTTLSPMRSFARPVAPSQPSLQGAYVPECAKTNPASVACCDVKQTNMLWTKTGEGKWISKICSSVCKSNACAAPPLAPGSSIGQVTLKCVPKNLSICDGNVVLNKKVYPNCTESVVDTLNCSISQKICKEGACIFPSLTKPSIPILPPTLRAQCALKSFSVCNDTVVLYKKVYSNCTESVVDTLNCSVSQKICKEGACVAPEPATEQPDTTPPAPVTEVVGNSIACDKTINWHWKNPADADFDHVEVYLHDPSGTNIRSDNILAPSSYWQTAGLADNTMYSVKVVSVDKTGNKGDTAAGMNMTWCPNENIY